MDFLKAPEALSAAMARAQAKLGHAAKRSENPTHRSRYADLAAVIDVLRAPLAEEGLWFLQPISFDEHGLVEVSTVICHASGEQLPAGVVVLRPMGDGPQAVGSAISYARRYGLSAAFGIAAAGDDDDGEKAEGRGPLTLVEKKGEEDPKPAESIRQVMEDRKEPERQAAAPAGSLDPERVKAKLGKTPRRSLGEDALANVTSLALLQEDDGKRLAMLQGAWRKLKLQGAEQPESLAAFGALDKPTLCLLYAALRDGLSRFAHFVEPPEQEGAAGSAGAPQEPAGADAKGKSRGKGGKPAEGLGAEATRKAEEMAAQALKDAKGAPTIDGLLSELEKGGDPA